MTTGIDAGLREGWVERKAKLFEAGEHPDKRIIVSDEDLVALAAAFSEPVPDRPPTMLPEEAAFFQRHFPGVPLTAIAEAKGG
jgi:hypothetical protein